MSSSRCLRAVVVVAAAAVLLASSCSWQLGTPIPEGVPPPAGDPVPAIDTHAPGRAADQLHQWAAERAPALGIPVHALEAYAYAARVAEVEALRARGEPVWPELDYQALAAGQVGEAERRAAGRH